ncbi:MAG: discoidin domain-containing protein [Candidatus Howiella sp.]
MKKIVSMFLSAAILFSIGASGMCATAEILPEETGYNLWMRYNEISDAAYRAQAAASLRYIVAPEEMEEPILSAVEELENGLSGLLGENVRRQDDAAEDGAILLGTKEAPAVAACIDAAALEALDDEGYLIRTVFSGGNKTTVIAGGGPNGVLYGAFKLLEMVQCQEAVAGIEYTDAPAIRWRVLDQWDNWNGSIERGYAGASIYKWDELPDTVDSRYTDFARANASIGINTIVINNVNAQTNYIRTENLPKIKAIADVFRKYGIRLALSVRFDSPIVIGGLGTADPLDDGVISWWEDKFDEIYEFIPDFAGILVKADSEGQPGPSQYGRTHADGANMFSRILAAHNDAVVMWRAFVYGAAAGQLSSDIVNQAYEFFKPLDGDFNDNVIVQSKNGPRDFLPCEPVSPLFGGMTKTNMGMEFQITQEYTGQSTHLCYLVPMWKSYLDFDMRVTGDNPDTSEGTTVARIVDGTVYGRDNTLIAGVSNVGSDTNWTSLELAQANWYGFGRLAWNPQAEERQITETWIKMTFGCDRELVDTVREVLVKSWDVYRSYNSPYAMGMTAAVNGHFDPAFSARNQSGMICIDAEGIGNNRNSTSTGENTDSTAQYSDAVGEMFDDITTCPEELLFWFHHVPYDFVMSNGKTMIENVYGGLKSSSAQIRSMRAAFAGLEGGIDSARLDRILASFDAQYTHAAKWREAMASFIEEQSGIPYDYVFTNLALGKTVVASQVRNDLIASNAVDGDRDSSRWGTQQEDTQPFIFVDLGEVKTVNRVTLYWENYSARYVIETATALTTGDGLTDADWTVAAECRGDEWTQAMYGKNTTDVLFADTQARYVRMRTTEKNSGLWNSVYEFEVYGDDFGETARYVLQRDLDRAQAFLHYDCTAQSLARLQAQMAAAEEALADGDADNSRLLVCSDGLKDAFAAMEFDDLARSKKARRNTVSGSNHAGNVLDGNGTATYWQAADGAGTPGVLTVDLRTEEVFDQIEIQWKSAPVSYKIEVSGADGKEWTLLREVVRAEEGFTGEVDTLLLSLPATARQLRLTTLERENTLSMYRFSVYDSGASDKAAALAVDDIIKALGEITSVSQQAEVEAARAAYDALTENQKALVIGLPELEAAEAKLAELCILRGDVDSDGRVTVSDVVALRLIITAGVPEQAQILAGDLDKDGLLTVSDVVSLRLQIVQG